jgi:hypothetical protein
MPRIAANRRAVTLTEVLIAIFLMGIGLMAILSLFPLGASQMAQAIQDQRTAEAAADAAAFGRIMWKTACEDDDADGSPGFVDRVPTSTTYQKPQARQRAVMAMDAPTYLPPNTKPDFAFGPPDGAYNQVPGTTPATAPPFLSPTAATASYPVLVDPIGWRVRSGSLDMWSAPTVPSNKLTSPQQAWRLPRRPVYVRDLTPYRQFGTTYQPNVTNCEGATGAPTSSSWVPLHRTANGLQSLLKQFSLTDDLAFDTNGAPLTTASQIERGGRYTWSYLIRRPVNRDRKIVDLTTIVYNGRSVDVPTPETAYSAIGTTGTKSLVIDYTGQDKPAVRRGGWVLDATLGYTVGNSPVVDPQGIFYRVVNVDDAVPNQLTVELQTPLLGGPPASNPPIPRTILVMEKVVEVFTYRVSPVSPPMPR